MMTEEHVSRAIRSLADHLDDPPAAIVHASLREGRRRVRRHRIAVRASAALGTAVVLSGGGTIAAAVTGIGPFESGRFGHVATVSQQQQGPIAASKMGATLVDLLRYNGLLAPGDEPSRLTTSDEDGIRQTTATFSHNGARVTMIVVVSDHQPAAGNGAAVGSRHTSTGRWFVQVHTFVTTPARPGTAAVTDQQAHAIMDSAAWFMDASR